MDHQHICIHGHFYQPPREDPWLGLVQPEGTAAPAANWNERIVAESYSPLAWARRLDGQGRITELVNCFEWISFNVGPTLLSWLERQASELYRRIIEADRRSVLRLGRGNAMAQVCHHPIMPLATPRDRQVEVAWAVQDFAHRFGRDPEGMWLPETAVDAPSLEVLADHGIRFTVLAPGQVSHMREPGGQWEAVGRGQVDISRPWRVELPSGRDMAVFLYNGPLSQAVAFEGLLADGERFWKRLTGEHRGGLTSIGTDGETYGHHFKYGEMALAYVLEMARAGREGFRLTNYAAYLAAHPPKGEIRLHEPSAWSCAHGVERWRSDCGCTDGGHPGWHQRWRAPLRRALDELKQGLDDHFSSLGSRLFHDPHNALESFGMVVCGSIDIEQFKRDEIKPQESLEDIQTALRLLWMQRWGLAMFASCAWFFDDLARVEPRGAMTMALRALELAESTGAGDLRTPFEQSLGAAEVNDERFANGAELWQAEVLPRRETGPSLAAQAVLTLLAEDRLPVGNAEATVRWPGASVSVRASEPHRGEAELSWYPCGTVERFGWSLEDHDPDRFFSGRMIMRPARGEAVEIRPAELFWKNREQVVLGWMEREDAARWERTLASGRRALSRFLEYRAYQSTQVRESSWCAAWTGLAAAQVVFGAPEPGGERLAEFLRAHCPGHPARSWLEERIGGELAELARGGEAGRMADMLSRAVAIGLSPHVHQAQNLAWELAERGGGEETLRVLGFAPLGE